MDSVLKRRAPPYILILNLFQILLLSSVIINFEAHSLLIFFFFFFSVLFKVRCLSLFPFKIVSLSPRVQCISISFFYIPDQCYRQERRNRIVNVPPTRVFLPFNCCALQNFQENTLPPLHVAARSPPDVTSRLTTDEQQKRDRLCRARGKAAPC